MGWKLVTTTCGPPTIGNRSIELLVKTYKNDIEGSKAQIKYGINLSEHAISDQSNQSIDQSNSMN